jgi:hypothetical protein
VREAVGGGFLGPNAKHLAQMRTGAVV